MAKIASSLSAKSNGFHHHGSKYVVTLYGLGLGIGKNFTIRYASWYTGQNTIIISQRYIAIRCTLRYIARFKKVT